MFPGLLTIDLHNREHVFGTDGTLVRFQVIAWRALPNRSPVRPEIAWRSRA